MSAELKSKLTNVILDDASIGRASPEVEQERSIAIFDLLEENVFQPSGEDKNTATEYTLKLSRAGGQFVFDIRTTDDTPVTTHILSMTPFRVIMQDYFMICESYHTAIRSASPSRIEAIDMGRRGVHTEGAELLQDRLKGKIDIDPPTARRLFTLICALYTAMKS